MGITGCLGHGSNREHEGYERLSLEANIPTEREMDRDITKEVAMRGQSILE